jgi:hypothetical protein
MADFFEWYAQRVCTAFQQHDSILLVDMVIDYMRAAHPWDKLCVSVIRLAGMDGAEKIIPTLDEIHHLVMIKALHK